MSLPEKKSNAGAVAGALAGLGFLGALIGVAASGGKKLAAKKPLGRPPTRVRGRGCGR